MWRPFMVRVRKCMSEIPNLSPKASLLPEACHFVLTSAPTIYGHLGLHLLMVEV